MSRKPVTKEDVIAILSAHDGIRDAETRAEVAAYLHNTFSKAEQYEAVASRVTALENEHSALAARVAALEAKVSQ
jgi:hypothetical protein